MKKERLLRILQLTALMYTIAFIVTTIVFICFNVQLFSTINELSKLLFQSLPLAHQQGQFYKILTISMMSGVSVCSLLIYKNPEQYISMIIPLTIMKFTSSLCGLIAFVSGFIYNDGGNNLANLVIFITDFPLGLWVLYLYFRLKRYDDCIT